MKEEGEEEGRKKERKKGGREAERDVYLGWRGMGLGVFFLGCACVSSQIHENSATITKMTDVNKHPLLKASASRVRTYHFHTVP